MRTLSDGERKNRSYRTETRMDCQRTCARIAYYHLVINKYLCVYAVVFECMRFEFEWTAASNLFHVKPFRIQGSAQERFFASLRMTRGLVWSIDYKDSGPTRRIGVWGTQQTNSLAQKSHRLSE
jgi:hypothetical protein